MGRGSSGKARRRAISAGRPSPRTGSREAIPRGRGAKPASRVVTKTIPSAAPELAPGTTFAGRYRVIEELGRGGMGLVYKVFDTKVKDRIALKLLPPQAVPDEEAVARFSNELKLARKISHRNICRLFDLGKSGGTSYITMEFVPGEDLKKLIRKTGRLEAGRAVSIARQVCEGLVEAHRLRVVHRDLKPQNIMVDEDGDARLMDFGIARSLSGKSLTRSGVAIGTLEYMSPEQAEGKEADTRSDVYALGVVLYEMVTGRRPFDGGTPTGVARKHGTPDPGKLIARLPGDLSGVILRCLEKDKEKRYPSAAELLPDLAGLERDITAAEQGDFKKRPSSAAKTVRRAAGIRLSQWALRAGVLAGLVAVVYAGYFLLHGRREALDSIAVLPFENVSSDPNAEFLCDGIAETIINKLAQVSDIKTVICRNSAFTYKGKTVDPKKIGRELGVKAVLLTRMMRIGDRLTISPSLVRVRDNSQIWGERYDRQFQDIFAIEDDISASVVQALRLRLTEKERQRISDRPIDNALAYECYLRANAAILSYKRGELDRAVQDLQRALDITGPNPLIYSVMSLACWQYVNIGARHEEYLAKAKEYAHLALALDPSLAKAHSVLAMINLYTDWRESIRQFKTVVAADPNASDALFWLGLIYLQVGKPEAALPLVERLKKVDPLHPRIFVIQAAPHFYEGRFDLALESYRRQYLFDPQNPVGAFLYALVLAYNKDFDEAFSVIEKCAQTDPDNALVKLGLLLKCGLQKDRNGAYRVMTPDFQRTCRRDGEWAYYVADALALLDEKKEALDWLENAVGLGFINYPFINGHDVFLDGLRGEPRFQTLLERVKYEWEHFEE